MKFLNITLTEIPPGKVAGEIVEPSPEGLEELVNICAGTGQRVRKAHLLIALIEKEIIKYEDDTWSVVAPIVGKAGNSVTYYGVTRSEKNPDGTMSRKVKYSLPT